LRMSRIKRQRRIRISRLVLWGVTRPHMRLRGGRRRHAQKCEQSYFECPFFHGRVFPFGGLAGWRLINRRMIDRIDSSLGREFILSAEKILPGFACFGYKKTRRKIGFSARSALMRP
jgi:hypothetical protein